MGAFAGTGSLVISSGAFSSAELDRDVDIDVVGDPDAYLGLGYPDASGDANPEPVTVASGEREDLFAALNRFTGEIKTFSADIVEGEDAFDDVSLHEKEDETDCINPDDENFEVGTCVQVEVAAECGPNSGGRESILVEIRAEGDGFEVDTRREFEVTCEPSVGRGIGVVAFCDLEEGDVVEVEASETDENGHPIGVSWKTTEDVDVVVTKAGYADSEGRSGPGMQNHYVGGAREGTVTADGEDPDEGQSPDSPCPGDRDGLRFEWNPADREFKPEN